ncbi:hypothetical protein HN51_028957 [Arachis hypogaea]|uniref:Transmembrane protein n=2 Tax=Arachis TaxID=3817 RepID=A0A445BGE7_ARAHY|nr:uncharacterized protein LOC107466712 [Arachis duranensis]XP_025620011.1 uncharacterized protein LOC112711544 [Arachis hypogaea]QHO35484.1 uncharacterized protein DS421_9g275850 [Arachis hypogaea]RYR37754.1 hypothetical protein Ahy_A09g042635 [Arachis hypogaea]
MTKTTTEIVVAQDNTQQPPQQPPPQLPHFPNLFAFLPKFNLQLPFLNLPPPKPKNADTPNADAAGDGAKEENKSSNNTKPGFVRFPKSEVVALPHLEAEVEESTVKTSNPFLLWQVYALGALFISSWVWARWNERKAQGKSPNDGRAEGSHSDDSRRSSDDSNN